MVIKVRALLSNRNFILLTAIAIGLSFTYAAHWTRLLILPVLSIMMTLAIIRFPGNVFSSFRSFLVPALLGIFMNYIILGNFIIAISAFLVREEPLWIGFVIMAAVPSAVSVVPFAGFLKGDETYAVAGTIGTYIGALIIIPIIAIGLLDLHSIDVINLFEIVMVLVILPIIISRLIVWKQLQRKIEPLKGIITDWSLFLILYTLTGLNREIIIGQPFSLVSAAVIAFASTFLLGFAIGLIGTFFHFNKEKLTSLLLLGTLKNYGLAGGLALLLFSKEAALPAMVLMVFVIIYIAWLDFKMRWA